MKTISIDNIKVGLGQPCFVVSEIGAMYEDQEGMKKLILASKDAGADAVKIQTYQAETLALPGATFQLDDGSVMSQFDFFKQYEISREDHKILFEFSKEIGIMMFSTPSHNEDVDFLDELGVTVFKTGSDDLSNYPFLEYIAKKGKPIILSTGMATLGEVDEAVRTVLNTGNDQLILLHCTTSYPPEPKYANLNIMKTLQFAFDLPVGYSDHIIGTLPSVLAVSMGACVVEKHVTLARNLKRPDYQVSVEPSELKEMVKHIRLIPVLKGHSVKKVYPPEETWRMQARKSLVAARDIEKGHILSIEDIKIVRAGGGLNPGHLKTLIGKALKKDLKQNEILSEEVI